ncbi:MAG: four helix bundle protein [Patescibacteria group bacterium]
MSQDNKKFSEELKRRIYNWILRLIKFLDTLSKTDTLCKTADNQLMRCGTSIGANYVEAIAGSSKKEFVNFLSYALKSANESKFWLALLRDANKGDKNEINELLKELIELANILASSVRTMRGK